MDERPGPSDPSKIVQMPSRLRLADASGQAPSEREATRAQIDELLIDLSTAPPEAASPVPTTHDPVLVVVEPRTEPPPPGHRNGVECPQCDRWTWRATEHCLHCGYNLYEHFEAMEAERQARIEARQLEYLADLRRKRLYWAGGLVFGGIMLMGNSMQASSDVGGQWMLMGGFGMFVLGMLVHFGSPK
ncbi:MAG: hypothetical protein ACREVW_04545 [Burkholderiales bacterium]